jgi:hypothetical protein
MSNILYKISIGFLLISIISFLLLIIYGGVSAGIKRKQDIANSPYRYGDVVELINGSRDIVIECDRHRCKLVLMVKSIPIQFIKRKVDE